MERRDLAGIIAKHGLEVTVTQRMIRRYGKRYGDAKAAAAANRVVDHYFREMMGWTAR